MSKASENSKNWEELAIGLYDKLTGRNAIIEYNFDSFKLGVPKEAGSEELTEWTMSGKISVTTYERK